MYKINSKLMFMLSVYNNYAPFTFLRMWGSMAKEELYRKVKNLYMLFTKTYTKFGKISIKIWVKFVGQKSLAR